MTEARDTQAVTLDDQFMSESQTNNQDQDLIKKIAKGDKKAFAILLEKYEDLVFGVSMKMVKDRDPTPLLVPLTSRSFTSQVQSV